MFDYATFRGIKINLDSASGTAGRRTQLHEFPGRDRPFVEDLGAASQKISFSGYFIGDDATSQRDALLEACAKPGSGTLVHPTVGTLNAVCTSIEYSESRTVGRRVDCKLEFVASGEPPAPGSQVATQDRVGESLLSMQVAALAEFQAKFSVAGLQNALLDQLGGDLSVIARIGSLATWAVTQADALADLAAGNFASDVAGTFASLLSLSGAIAIGSRRWQEKSKALSSMASAPAGWKPPAQTTSSRIQQASGQTALATAVTIAAASGAAQLGVTCEPVSSDEAKAVRTACLAVIDQAIEACATNGWDASYQALKTLRAETARDLSTRGASLAPLVLITLPGPVASLALAHRIYADIGSNGARAEDLVARAGASHPGFLSGSFYVLAP